jgi:hypothetical protein
MTFGFTHLRNRGLTALLVVAPGLMPTTAWALWPKILVQPAAPAYVQQAPTATTYAAPSVYSAPAVYAAPPMCPAPGIFAAPSVYSAPSAYSAPAVYSAPAAAPYAAPAATVGSAPAVGSAPGDGYRIKPVDRNDIIGELRKEASENTDGGSTRERRKALRESATTKYAEAIGVDESDLYPTETRDIDGIVNSIIDSGGVGQAPAGTTGYAPTPYNYNYNYNYAPSAPGYAPAYAPSYGAPAMIVQPLAPVQLFVPVQPKHHLFGW